VRETAPFVRTLVSLVRDLDRRFTEKKLDRGGLDFSDLERYCLMALESDGGQVAQDVRRGFDAVLIDEYQDTNPLQERILSLVCSQDGRASGSWWST
jgi:ATP-dependent helicase/nuclease subunit A